MPSRKDGTRVGDEGKAVGIAQAPAALLSPHNPTIRSVITITQSRFFHSRVQGLRNSSDSFAIFAAIRRAQSALSAVRTDFFDGFMDNRGDPSHTTAQICVVNDLSLDSVRVGL
jgi:hypothetical protein